MEMEQSKKSFTELLELLQEIEPQSQYGKALDEAAEELLRVKTLGEMSKWVKVNPLTIRRLSTIGPKTTRLKSNICTIAENAVPLGGDFI